ncbi:hypothetical protein HHL21_10535 [Massilia sp. RP-1-19]|uniref:Uncharacterized protein n=1 Tax=Massilia polaris TaxID=2728846 RepID=A0A848HKD8_9BURK|nr:hypothetical protein [Massilia polaris]NML61507.1 hypothetical protein [Massilia polaris]
MLSFSTEFPVPPSVSRQEFCDLVKTWISGSRYTRFKFQAISDLGAGESWEAIEDSEIIESLAEVTADTESVAITYRKQDADFEWISTVVLAILPSSSWISVRVECEPLHPRARVPNARKPVLVKLLLEKFGGGVDGAFKVGAAPIVLTQSELDLATKCIEGDTGSYLPIVYVSAAFNGVHLVDPHDLARDLAGMAHVVVEPDRAFSLNLMEEVQRKNPYGGTIALYWPEGGGRRSFFARPGTETPDHLLEAIFDEIRLSMINRRPLTRCTLAAVKELKSRRLINALKDVGSAEVDKYIEAFEADLQSKIASLQAAESEIDRLKAEIRRYEAQETAAVGLALNTGAERDFYDGELHGIVHDAISAEISRVPADSRRLHVLQALQAANAIAEGRTNYREKIKELLRGYQSMDNRTKRELEMIGFTITEQGKHNKLVYRDDDRYTFTLAKSGSDHRGGLNAAGDISRLLFS